MLLHPSGSFVSKPHTAEKKWLVLSIQQKQGTKPLRHFKAWQKNKAPWEPLHLPLRHPLQPRPHLLLPLLLLRPLLHLLLLPLHRPLLHLLPLPLRRPLPLLMLHHLLTHHHHHQMMEKEKLMAGICLLLGDLAYKFSLRCLSCSYLLTPLFFNIKSYDPQRSSMAKNEKKPHYALWKRKDFCFCGYHMTYPIGCTILLLAQEIVQFLFSSRANEWSREGNRFSFIF
uniref:Uncharacterized protein n=1 Tax=Phakopsora pachyrhizi TaxID=170000 RepID=A0A0S1MIW5_PHAPC